MVEGVGGAWGTFRRIGVSMSIGVRGGGITHHCKARTHFVKNETKEKYRKIMKL